MKLVRDILSLALATSGVVGAWILVSDRWLWLAAASHAYGLIGFVALDIILSVGVLRRTPQATMGAVLISVAQLGAMLADIVTGQPEGVPSIAFRNYLLNDTSYLGLLAIQIGILAIAVRTLAMPRVHKLHRWRPNFLFERR